jgi:hypothetical protein
VCERIPYLIFRVMQLSSKASSRAVGKPPGSPRSTEPKDLSRIPSRSRRACVDLHRTEGSVVHAVGQLPGMRRSYRTIRRSVTQAVGQPPGKRRTIRRSDTRKPPGPRRTSHRIRRRSDTRELSSSRRASAMNVPARKPQPSETGELNIEPNPLDYSAVNPLTVGELGRIAMGGVIPV